MTPSMFGWVSAWSAAAATAVLSDPRDLERIYFPTLEKRLSSRRYDVLQRLTQPDIPHVVPEACFFVFIDLSRWMDKISVHGSGGGGGNAELELLPLMMTSRIFLESGQAFFTLEKGWFRLNYGGSEDAVRLGFERLAECLQLIAFKDEVDDEEEEVYEKRACDHEQMAGRDSRLMRWRRRLCFESED
ncbi:hypothetical protein B0T11DRAFT_298897 [Plectosphaerella cucumerina]|uniref:Aminotransferase class I/classII large domain-containing protein n=1 Tax=Plectosphaerella cucumerina TaxID=40658 RepID=A0A8K0T7E9_9PEZI|nr:hypothetical protein B0T11DRAFT_298897 [Plectosphaerella cucumerina]